MTATDTYFVISNGTSFLSWDDKGAMASGYPHWTRLPQARQYYMLDNALNDAESAWKCDKSQRLFIVEVEVTETRRTEFTPVELDPEWQEYLRLKERFKNR